MAETTAGGDWRDAVRPYVEAAWEALDQAALTLYRQYKETGDEQIARFKDDFDRAFHALIGAVLDDLFPEEDPDATEDDCADA